MIFHRVYPVASVHPLFPDRALCVATISHARTDTDTRARTHIRTCSGATTEIHFGRIGPDIIRHSSCERPPQATPRPARVLPPPPASPRAPGSRSPSVFLALPSRSPPRQAILAIRSHCANTRQRTRLYFDRQVVRMRNGSGVSSEITACPIRLLVSLSRAFSFPLSFPLTRSTFVYLPFSVSTSTPSTSFWLAAAAAAAAARGHCSMVPEATASGLPYARARFEEKYQCILWAQKASCPKCDKFMGNAGVGGISKSSTRRACFDITVQFTVSASVIFPDVVPIEALSAEFASSTTNDRSYRY